LNLRQQLEGHWNEWIALRGEQVVFADPSPDKLLEWLRETAEMVDIMYVGDEIK
jgi:hypothetical protein